MQLASCQEIAPRLRAQGRDGTVGQTWDGADRFIRIETKAGQQHAHRQVK